MRNGGSINASPTSVAATPPSRSSDAVMSADLWAMAHTPPPTEARRTLGYHPLGPTREEPATAPPTEAATDARRRVAALSEAAAAAVEDGLRRLASARRATSGVEEGTSKRTEGEGFMAREFTSMLDDIASGAESVSGDGDEGDRADGTKSSSVEDAGTDQEKPAEKPRASAAWEADKENRHDPELKWSAEDAAKVHAARAAAERAEAAERAVLEQERAVREKVTLSIRELLDARVGLAAATARSVAETAASSAVFAAAEVAALKVTLNSARSKGNPDDPTSEALAEVFQVPLPGLKAVFRT